jgi:flavodoxin
MNLTIIKKLAEELNYDSSKDTLEHKKQVAKFLKAVAKELERRAETHDDSKLEDFEKKYFDKITPILKGLTYGSDEYKESLKEMQEGLDHHYKNNSHHPEHFKNSVNGMSLVDLIEMLFDWKASAMRHDDGDIMKSIEINKKRFKLSDQLVDILKNSIKNI